MGPAVHVGHNVAAGIAHVNLKAFHLNSWLGRRRFGAFAGLARSHDLADERFPKEARGVGVIVDAEHEFIRGRVKTCAAPHHLIKSDR
jgi:hypothetical protein